MSRKTAREAAFKTIYEIPFHTNDLPGDIIDFCITYHDSDVKNEKDINFFKKVTSLCYDNIEAIDNKISDNLKENWTITRLSKVNLSILRLAYTEILYMEDIPYQVSVNEAVEIAKKYSDDDAPSFINAILSSSI